MAVTVPSEPASSTDWTPTWGTRTLLRRLFAVAIDSAIILLLQTAVSGPFAPITLHIVVDGGVIFSSEQPSVPIWPWTVILSVFYFAAFEIPLAATPGKFLAGLRVVSRTGGKPTPYEAGLRNLLRPIDMIGNYALGIAVVLLKRRRQRVGDLAAHTYVLDADMLAWARASLLKSAATALVMVAAIAAVALAGETASYLFAPPLAVSVSSPGASSMAGGAVFGAPARAQRVRFGNVISTRRSPGRAEYQVAYSIQLRRGRRRDCTANLTYVWHGLPGGWLWQTMDSRCGSRRLPARGAIP